VAGWVALFFLTVAAISCTTYFFRGTGHNRGVDRHTLSGRRRQCTVVRGAFLQLLCQGGILFR
jgi:hypothetical protein